ncbi:Transient receptor potential cation channel subfamily M member 3 [Lamellibrachia satsuma]|nr:Transient receptor potential cation channel subfamily M member 3 [Lamellibrachia satsuma]
MQEKTDGLTETAQKLGLKVNTSKTKLMKMNHKSNDPVTINNSGVDEVNEFTNLGSKIATYGDSEREVNSRITKANLSFAMLKNIWKLKQVSFVMFMTLFSYVVMTNLRPTSEEGSPAISEYVLWGCSVTLVVEEVRQGYSTTSNYLCNPWNQLDLIAYSTLILSVMLRYTVPDSHFSVARMTYCVALVIFYLRFLQVFFINKNIGPKVIIVRRMVTDVMFFVCILLVFMVSYGTVSQALRYPNSPLSWSLLRDVISYPFWFVLGQFNQEEMEGNVGECTSDPDVSSASHGLPRCPETSWLLVPISGAYLVIANILLLNLLIAMFSNTFQNVQDQSETLWRYYLYDLIYEYFDKPALPPPLIVFDYLHRVWQFAAKRLCQTCKRKHVPEACGNAFCRSFSKSVNNELTKFERYATEKYLLKKHQRDIDTKVYLTRERIDKMAADLEDIKERMK